MEFCAFKGRPLPGIRFYPTDVELVMYYLKRKVLGKPLTPVIVAEVDIYQYHPKDLRELAHLKKDLCWYFFCPRENKYGRGERTKRATDCGFWKPTGLDRIVSYKERPVGTVKTLVFHEGKPKQGVRTNWVMHEFKLKDENLDNVDVRQDSYVLCKVFQKSGLGPKNAEQYGAPFIEEEWSDDEGIPNCAQVVPTEVQNQSTFSVSSVLNCHTNACLTSTSDQVYSGVVSISVVDQPPLSNTVSLSNHLIPNNGDTLNKAPASMSVAASSFIVSSGAISVIAVDQSPACAPKSNVAASLASSSKAPMLDDNDAANQTFSSKALNLDCNYAANHQASSSMAPFLDDNDAVDLASSLKGPNPNYNPAANQPCTWKNQILDYNAAANLASSSKGLIPDYNPVVDQATPDWQIPADWNFLQDWNFPAVHMPASAQEFTDAGLTSMGHFPYSDHEMFTREEFFEDFPCGDGEMFNEGEKIADLSNKESVPEDGMSLIDLDNLWDPPYG